MHTRRLITFLLGAWFALLLMVGGTATLSFQVADHTVAAPPPETARALQSLGQPATRQLFRYVAAEMNRTLFESAGLIEVLLALVLTILLFMQNYSRAATLLCGVILLAALGSHFLLTPQLIAQGRILDFRPPDAMLADRARFAKLHMMFGVMSVFRVAGIAVIAALFLRRRGGRRSGQQLDAVNNTQDSHIDR